MKQDLCCWACKSTHGICRNAHCDHHLRAREQDEADDRARRTVRRPTEDKAIANVMRSTRRKGKAR